MEIGKNEIHEEVVEKSAFWGLLGEASMVLLAQTHGYRDLKPNIHHMLIFGVQKPSKLVDYARQK